MSFKSVSFAALAVAAFALPAFAESNIAVTDPYVRVSTKMSKSGAAFLIIENTGDEDDRLIDARSDVAKRVELHTHKENSEGVMQMLHVKEGFAIAAGGTHMLKRGGDHVMFMGLHHGLSHGDVVGVTLVFEKAGEIAIDVPVDLERTPVHGAMKKQDTMGAHKHGSMD